MALDIPASIGTGARTVAVLGNMLELGEDSRAMKTEQIIDFLRERG